MSSYWRNEAQIQVKQTQISVPSINGRSYSGVAGQSGRRVDFEIPPNVKFMDGKNSYLQFGVKVGLPSGAVPTRLHLDPFIGGQSVVKNIRIYSNLGGRTLLEEVTDYNAKVQIQYSYNQDESMRKMRALKEGSLVSTVENRGTLGTSESNNIDTSTNPYYKPVGTVPAGRNWGTADDFLTAKLSLPIHTGIFADSDKIFPVMLTEGLYIEIDLEDPAKFLKQLDSVNRHRRVQQNPLFHGTDEGGTNWTVGDDDITEVFLTKDNNMLSVENCPFVKGETINICEKGDINKQANLTKADGTIYSPVISDITKTAGGFIKLTLAENTRNTSSSAGNPSATIDTGNWIVYSSAIDKRRVGYNDGAQTIAPITKYEATCEFTDFEIVVQQVELDSRYEAGMVAKMKEGGAIELDILSATNYKHSLLKSNRNATINFPVSNTRAKCSLIALTDAKVYNSAQLIGSLGDTYDEEALSMDGELHSIRTGQVGIIDELTSYQFVIDDKLVPTRPIVVSKINKGKSISAQPLIELEKALNQAKIVPRSFCDYNRNFIIGRAYALNDGVANLNNKSNQLQLLYNEKLVDGTDKPPQHDKLAMCFVFHLRRILIKGNSVTVVL